MKGLNTSAKTVKTESFLNLEELHWRPLGDTCDGTLAARFWPNSRIPLKDPGEFMSGASRKTIKAHKIRSKKIDSI